MEMLHNVWEWVSAVIHNWHGYVGGSVLGFVLELFKKFREWEPSKKVFASALGVGLLVSMFSAWQEQREIAQTAKKATDTANKQFEQLSQPKFELNWTPPVLGDGVMEQNGRKAYFTESYLQVGILNHGAPSVIKHWKGFIRLTNGTEIEGHLLGSGDKNIHVPVHTKLGRIELPTSPSLIPRWSTTPIPTGGRGVGTVIFLFPPGQKEKMEGGAVIVKLWDISDKEYKIEIPWRKEEHPELRMPEVLPGMNDH